MGRSQRRKGGVGEREAAHELTRLTGRTWMRTGWMQRVHGSQIPDIAPAKPADVGIISRRVGGELVHVEVKRQKWPNIFAALEQAAEGGEARGAMPIALVRRDSERWVLAIYLDDLPRLVRAFWRKA